MVVIRELPDWVGGASAATLGFITADVPGAVAGYKLYKKYGKSLSKMVNGRSNKRRKLNSGSSVGTTPNPGHPKHIFSSSQKRLVAKLRRNKALAGGRRSNSAVSKNASDRVMTSRASGVAVARRRRTIKKFHSQVGQKRVKVSKEFKKKVKQVLSDKLPQGYAQEIYVRYLNGPSFNNKQAVDSISNGAVDSIPGQYFSPSQIINIASFLWGNVPYSVNQNYNTGIFNYENTKINVKKQWVTVKYRNNTQRSYTIVIYASRRKNKIPLGAQTKMLDDWNSALANDTTGGVNIGTVSSSTIYATPYMCKQVMDNWTIESTKVVLAPGEEYVYTLDGPSKMYDFRKNWINGLVAGAAKETVDLCHVCYCDMVLNAAGTIVGRIGENNHTNGYAVVYEVNTYYKLEMPDQTGITWATAPGAGNATQALPVNGGTTMLGNRRDAYAIWQNGDVTAIPAANTVLRVDRETPTTVGAN